MAALSEFFYGVNRFQILRDVSRGALPVLITHRAAIVLPSGADQDGFCSLWLPNWQSAEAVALTKTHLVQRFGTR
jgi:hypothetical protein